MQRAPVCPECGSPDVVIGDARGACNGCSYWGPVQHFFCGSVDRVVEAEREATEEQRARRAG